MERQETTDELMQRIWKNVLREERERERQKVQELQHDPITPELFSRAQLGKKLMAELEADQRGDDIFDDDVFC